MAINDIRPFDGPGGGHVRKEHFPLVAGATFREGEPVRLNNAGEVAEATAPAIVAADIVGIAAANGDTAGASGGDQPTITYPTVAADGLPNAGDLIAVYMPDMTTRFITHRFSTGGAGVQVVPTQANAMSEGVGLVRTGGNWFADTGAATNIGRITRVLDINKDDIIESGLAGVWVVFAITVHQMTDAGDPLA